MSAAKKPLAAIHDWHLDRVLRELGLEAQIQIGDARCARCGAVLSRERIGGILVLGDDEYDIVCDRVECIAQADSAGTR